MNPWFLLLLFVDMLSFAWNLFHILLLRKYLLKSFIHYNTQEDIISRHNWFIMFYGEHVYAVHWCNRNWDIRERYNISITFLALLSLLLSQLFSVWMGVLSIVYDGIFKSLHIVLKLYQIFQIIYIFWIRKRMNDISNKYYSLIHLTVYIHPM